MNLSNRRTVPRKKVKMVKMPKRRLKARKPKKRVKKQRKNPKRKRLKKTSSSSNGKDTHIFIVSGFSETKFLIHVLIKRLDAITRRMVVFKILITKISSIPILLLLTVFLMLSKVLIPRLVMQHAIIW